MTLSIELAVIGTLAAVTTVVLALVGAARQRRKDREEQKAEVDAKIADLRREVTAKAVAMAEATGALKEWRRGVDAQLASRKDATVMLGDRLHQDHRHLSDKVDGHFEATGQVLDGLEKRIERLAGRLEGKGVI